MIPMLPECTRGASYSTLAGLGLGLSVLVAAVAPDPEPYSKNCANKMAFNPAAIPNDESTV